MRTIIRQPTVAVRQQADEVKQAGDVRVRLAIVVAEQAFVVSNQAGVHVRSDELVIVRETLRGREFQRAIVTTTASETADSRISEAKRSVVLSPGLKMKYVFPSSNEPSSITVPC